MTLEVQVKISLNADNYTHQVHTTLYKLIWPQMTDPRMTSDDPRKTEIPVKKSSLNDEYTHQNFKSIRLFIIMLFCFFL